jgi:hypothetical protein
MSEDDMLILEYVGNALVGVELWNTNFGIDTAEQIGLEDFEVRYRPMIRSGALVLTRRSVIHGARHIEQYRTF